MKKLFVRTCISVFFVLVSTCGVVAQTLAGDKLVEALKQGHLVIVMRHTSSPRTEPDAATANSDNVNHERQLDDKGRRDAEAIGEALRRLQIPVGSVLSSPAYRALETARLAKFENVATRPELGNDGMAESSVQYAAWLREQVMTLPEAGNVLLITHGPNISAAFPDESEGMEEGEALVFNPAAGDGQALQARIKSADWAAL